MHVYISIYLIKYKIIRWNQVRLHRIRVVVYVLMTHIISIIFAFIYSTTEYKPTPPVPDTAPSDVKMTMVGSS